MATSSLDRKKSSAAAIKLLPPLIEAMRWGQPQRISEASESIVSAIEENHPAVARRIVAYRDSIPAGLFNIKAVERRDLPNVVLVCYQIGTRHLLWLSIYRQREHGTAGAVTKARMSMRAKACLGMFKTPDQAAEIIIREACQVLQLPEPTHALIEIIDHNGVPLVADPFRGMSDSML